MLCVITILIPLVRRGDLLVGVSLSKEGYSYQVPYSYSYILIPRTVDVLRAFLLIFF